MRMPSFSRAAALAVTAVLVIAIALVAQPRERRSPHETVKGTIDGANLTIEYGRPYMKGRQVEGGLIPYDRVWRTGADEATTLTTDKALKIGNVSVPAGKYTLYTQASEGEWKLVINRQTGQWGTVYDEKQDLGRVDANVSFLETPVETLTIEMLDTPAGGTFVMEFANIRAEVPFVVH